MGRCGPYGCELGVVDGLGGWPHGGVYMFQHLEEGFSSHVLDDYPCHGGVVRRYVRSLHKSKSDRIDFVMCIGFMTFSPEWLTGNQNLDASNFMFLWVYLVFFNILWVVMPIYAMWVSYQDINNAFLLRSRFLAVKLETQKLESEKDK
jgi:hypothetical protein